MLPQNNAKRSEGNGDTRTDVPLGHGLYSQWSQAAGHTLLVVG